MATKTPQQHADDKALAEQLIARGRIRSWAQLGRAFGISGQAAHARFGPKGYGLTLPRRERQDRKMVSVSLGPALDAHVEQIRATWPHEEERPPSRARVVRMVLAEQLPRYVQDAEEQAARATGS